MVWSFVPIFIKEDNWIASQLDYLSPEVFYINGAIAFFKLNWLSTVSALQDCFETTGWQMFQDSFDSNINICTDCSNRICTCTENIVPVISVLRYPNQKPWINCDVWTKLRDWSIIFNSGDMEVYRSAKYNLHKAFKHAKRDYKTKVELPWFRPQIHQRCHRSNSQYPPPPTPERVASFRFLPWPHYTLLRTF